MLIIFTLHYTAHLMIAVRHSWQIPCEKFGAVRVMAWPVLVLSDGWACVGAVRVMAGPVLVRFVTGLVVVRPLRLVVRPVMLGLNLISRPPTAGDCGSRG